MLIAVPGWPLPTFWTASIASTRAVSIARRSRSPKPSGRVGLRLGRAAGGRVARGLGRGLGLGALRHVLGCSLGDRPWRRAAACGRPGPALDRGRTVVVDVGPTRCTRSINAINPSHPRSTPCRAPVPARATVARVPIPGSKGPRAVRLPCSALLPARCRARGHPVTALSERSHRPRPPPAQRAPRPGRRLRRADQAADHRAAAGDDGAGDDAGRRAAGRRCRCCCHAARRHARRGRGQRLQLLLRPRHRPADAPHPEAAAGRPARSPPRAALVFGVVLTVIVDRAAGG